MEINIKEQEAKLKAEAQAISEELAQAQNQANIWAEKVSQLIRLADRNQGALDLLNNLNGEKPESE